MSASRRPSFARAIDPSFLIAAVLTVAFYVLMFQPSMEGTLLYQYTTEHAVEYAIVALFIWGAVDAVGKLLAFPREVFALRQDWLPARHGREPASNAQALLAEMAKQPAWLQKSRVGRRLQQALEYVIEKGAAQQYREHLQYLAEQDEDAVHASYTLMRFVVGVTPVLGFLGTVVHFGTALSGISFDEMAEKLPTIVGHMGAAFNATTVALAAAMSMMFSLFLCERVDRGITRSVDRLVDRELLNRFDEQDADVAPLVETLRTATVETLQSVVATLDRQVASWTQALEGLFQRFDQRQQQESDAWRQALEGIEKRHSTQETSHREQWRQSLALFDDGQRKQLSQMQSLLQDAHSVKADMSGLIEALAGISQNEGDLVRLQSRLADNLQLLHETKKIDDALHGLTAAIHLMTARQRQAA